MYVTLATTFALMLVIMCCRDAISRFYSTDTIIQELTSQVLILVTFIFFFDSMQAYLQGPIRAVGLQGKASLYTIVAFYAIGLPLAWYLGIKREMGVMGL